MKKIGMELVKDITDAVLKKLETVPMKDVLVGVPAAETTRTSEESGSITNAMLGYIHENGAPEVNIPPRPFLVPGIREAKEEIANYLEQAGKAAVDGRIDIMDRALHAAGLVAQTSVKQKITEGPFIPLKASTLSARRRRGHKGTRPLIETSQLHNSITYVIRNKKD